MLKISGLSKSYGAQDLFNRVNLQMNAGERLGLVGRNGHGKSTLFRLILGQEEADEGGIGVPKGYKIGHLEQHLNFTQYTVLDEACQGLPPDEWEATYKAEKILSGLGFSEEDFYKPPQQFSGGFQIRINLAKLLLSEPNLLLLDEPTNYLDILSIRWITQFLRNWKGEIILISHDRDFMDSVCTHSAIIHRGQVRKIEGPTEKLYAQILLEEEVHEKTRQNEEKKRKKEEEYIERFRAKASKASSVQSRIKRLAKMPALEKLAHIDHLDFSFHYANFEAEYILKASNLDFAYSDGPSILDDFSLSIKSQDRIAIVGKNGKGKSTLLNVLAGEYKAQAGEIYLHPSAKLGYFGQTNIQRLTPGMTVAQEIESSNPDLSRTAVANIAATMMFEGDAASKKISVLSGGEKSRVLLGKVLAQPVNLLFLDEPTNHLDMESIEALLESIEDFDGAVVMVTHSEMILNDFADRLVVFDNDSVQVFEGGYADFLERVGWSEESKKKDEKKKAKELKNNNKTDIRRQRAEVVAERSEKLGPLKKQIEALEAQIAQGEAALKEKNDILLQASQSNRVEEFMKLSKEVKALQPEVDKAYAKLDEVLKEYEEKNARYEEELAKLD